MRHSPHPEICPQKGPNSLVEGSTTEFCPSTDAKCGTLPSRRRPRCRQSASAGALCAGACLIFCFCEGKDRPRLRLEVCPRKSAPGRQPRRRKSRWLAPATNHKRSIKQGTALFAKRYPQAHVCTPKEGTPKRPRAGVSWPSTFCWSCAGASWRPRPSTQSESAPASVFSGFLS